MRAVDPIDFSYTQRTFYHKVTHMEHPTSSVTNPGKAFALIALGLAIAAIAAFLTHAVSVTAPLFAQPSDVPSVSQSAPSPQWAVTVDRARPMVRAAIVEQNLPGVSIAVGVGGGIAWAEGFGWR